MRHLVKEIYAAVKALHSQVFVALFTVILILAIPQIQELIKMFAEDGWGVSTAHTFLALIGLYLLTWSIWVSGRWLTVRLIEVDHEAENEALRSLTPFEVWLPRVLGVLPQVAILILIVKLLFFDRSIEPVLHRIILWFYAIFITATSVAFIHYTKKRKQNSAQRTSHEDALVTRGRGAFNIPMWGYGAVVGFVTVLALTLSTNAAFTRYFGTLFLAFAFLSFLVLLLTLLNWHSKKHGVPYILLLALIAVYVAWSDISDNHRLTLAPKVVEKPSSSDAFESWYKNLAERYDSTTNQDAIPVYLVAAQGGGIFAAYHSAMFLAAVEDDCPGFSDHLFAISSVSGGSLGSALFVDVLRERKVNPRKQKPVLNDVQFTKPNKFKDLPTCSPVAASLGEEELSSSQSQLLTADLKRAFQDDWLSPIVARTLFSEPVLTFLPLPCSSADEGGFLHKFCARFDQAKTLEASLRRSARRGRSDRETHLIESFSSYYSTELHLPNLLINTADSTSGRRVVMSPMTFKAAGMSNMDLYLADTKDISVSEAAVLSARFPFFTQAGYVVEEESAIHLCKGSEHESCRGHNGEDGNQKPLKVRFVDGGYNDNSGLQTIEDLIKSLEQSSVSGLLQNVEFHVISLTGKKRASIAGNAFNELGTPIKAMLKMWGGKAEELQHELVQYFPSEREENCRQPNSHYGGFYRAVLDTDANHIPLGWHLSNRSRKAIESNIEKGLDQVFGECS